VKIPVLLRPVALGVHLFGAFCVGLAVWLGFWQLSTWEGHRTDASAESIERETELMIDVIGPDQPFQKDQVARPVTASGEWLTDSTVYVQGRLRDGVEGYWVTTMLAVDGSESAVPVVRGWAASIDPRPALPTGTAEIEGWLQPPEGKRGLPDDDASDDVLPQMRMADLVQHADRDLFGGYLLVNHEAAQGNAGTDELLAVDLEQVPAVSATTGWRNFLYAVEWWIFASFALFIWFRWCRDEVVAERTGRRPGDPEPAGEETSPTTGVDTEGEDQHVHAEA
jgi:surfeit locus 1 family protein